jgi:hypothetical protein
MLPCCLLLLNLCNDIIAYKAKLVDDGILRTLFIIAFVLFGSSVVAFAVSPGLIWIVQALRRTSREGAGGVGETVFLLALGVVIFWLYYRNFMLGTQSILPPSWRNHAL